MATITINTDSKYAQNISGNGVQYPFFLFEIMQPNLSNSKDSFGRICINNMKNYNDLYSFVIQNHLDKIKPLNSNFFDLPQYLKILFNHFFEQSNLNNPFTNEEMNYLFGYSEGNFLKIPDMKNLLFDFIPLFDKDYVITENCLSFFYSFNKHFLNDNQKETKYSNYPQNFWIFCEKLKYNQTLIDLLNQFINQIPQLQIQFYNQHLYGMNHTSDISFFEFIKDEHELKELKNDWFITGNIDLNSPNNDVLFSINLIYNESQENIPRSINLISDEEFQVIIPIPKYHLDNYYEIIVKRVAMEYVPFELKNNNFQYVTDNQILNEIKQTLPDSHPIQQWILQPNQIIEL